MLTLLPILLALCQCSGPDDEPVRPVAPVPRKLVAPPQEHKVTTPTPVASQPRQDKPDIADETVVRHPISGSVYPFLSSPLSATTRLEGEKVLEQMRNSWRLSWGGSVCGTRRSGFNSPFTVSYLFARGYPELAEEWAQHASDSASVPWETRPAAQILCELARNHYGKAESTLRRLCRSSDEYVRKEARAYFASVDRAALLALAMEGDQGAIELLSFRTDLDALDFCRRLIVSWADRPQPWLEARENARLAVTRLEALTANKWEEWVRTIIEKESSEHPHFFWALDVAKDRRPVWLHKTLRARLTSEYRKRPVRLDPQGENGFVFDYVLLTLGESGGSVDQKELSYLQRFGFACDPREWLIDTLGLVPRLRKKLALERVLNTAQFSLAEMTGRSLREVGNGTVVSATLTIDSHGFGWARAWVVTGGKTLFVENNLSGSMGSVGPDSSDQAELAKAAKTTLKDAIETALKKERGTAIEARCSFNESKRAEFSVHVYLDGKVRIVIIDAENGQVTSVKDGQPIEELPRR